MIDFTLMRSVVLDCEIVMVRYVGVATYYRPQSRQNEYVRIHKTRDLLYVPHFFLLSIDPASPNTENTVGQSILPT